MQHEVTTNGVPNKLINGSADRVYEEEFSFAQSFCWSRCTSTVRWPNFVLQNL